MNLFSPWYSWKIAELVFNNNNSLTFCILKNNVPWYWIKIGIDSGGVIALPVLKQKTLMCKYDVSVIMFWWREYYCIHFVELSWTWLYNSCANIHICDHLCLSSLKLASSVTLYEMLSVTSSRSLCFTALLCMQCCQWLPADRYVSQRYFVWNVVSDFQQIVMFHSVTLYEMLSVTSSRSLCFTALLCMKCCQWIPADHYVSQR
jgi:hypothetical protein